MTSITPFALRVKDLTSLGPDRAVEFFRRLLWAEAARVNIGRHLIDVPDCINVGDGGVDALIENAAPVTDELIPQGTTGFQIKSSDLTPKECKRELHVDGRLDAALKPELKRILDNGGTYVLVLFADITGRGKRERRESGIRDELDRLGYDNPIRLYSVTQLIGFAERFTSLVTWLKNDLSRCLSYPSWADRRDVSRPNTFVLDDERKKWIDEVRKELRSPGEDCPVFRVTGLSGIGKTRLVFEALSPYDLQNRVIYVRADTFLSSELYLRLQTDQDLSAIIVVDECDLNQHNEIVRAFASRGSRLAVITISHDIGNVPHPTNLYRLGSLGRQEIEQLLEAEAPELSGTGIRRLSEFSDGYPYIAVLLVESYLQDGEIEDDFIVVSDEALMNRLIGGNIDISSDRFNITKKTLMGVSLFQKVGYKEDLSSEAEWVANTMQVDWHDFRQTVEQQKRRGVIQGQYYISVTPFMLRVHLLREWWNYQGFTKESFVDFVVSIPQDFRADLLSRFFDNIPYITTTARGKEFAKSILAQDGIFSDGSLLKTGVGANFFMSLAEADPETALKCLKRTVGTWSREELLDFTTGRRQVVRSLERIAVWRNLLPDAARLLLALAEAETETWANNASGIFVELFSPGYGQLAVTEAPPQERFPVLEAALESSSKERRVLALRACDNALQSQRFSRTVGAEYQGLHREPELWMPESYEELFDAYRWVWHLLYKKLDDLREGERQQGVDILLRRARGLGMIPNLATMVIDTVEELTQKPYVQRKDVLKHVDQVLHYQSQSLPEQTRQRWEALRDKLTGEDFDSRLERYVGMNLLRDRFDEQGNRSNKTQRKIEELADQASNSHDLLQARLGWLITTDTPNAHRFGYELGMRDNAFSLLPQLLEAQRNAVGNANILFLGGYLRAIFEQDRDCWEDQLDSLMDDPALNVMIPELTRRSGITDRAAIRILELAKRDIIEVDGLWMYGVQELSEKVFTKCIKFLLNSTDTRGVSAALAMYHSYYLDREFRRKLPEDLSIQLLTSPLLYQESDTNSHHQMDDYYWTDIGVVFVEQYPEANLQLADHLLKNCGKRSTILDFTNSRPQTVLNKITRRQPEEVWKLITKYLGPPIDSRAYRIRQWLRGDDFLEKREGALSLIPPKEIWKWIDENVENRAWYVATFVPNKLFREADKICLARELLVRYGERDDVQENLMANFSTEGWVGPESEHHQKKKQQLLEFKKEETDTNVKGWIDAYVDSIEQQIEYARIWEERRERS